MILPILDDFQSHFSELVRVVDPSMLKKGQACLVGQTAEQESIAVLLKVRNLIACGDTPESEKKSMFQTVLLKQMYKKTMSIIHYNLISIHFFTCSETAIPVQQMKSQLDVKASKNLPL